MSSGNDTGADKKIVEIGIIGAGEVGSNLLEIFIKMSSIKVKYMADRDESAQGMRLAREVDVKTTTDIMEVVEDGDLHLILEVTGSNKVLNIIKENKSEDTEVISGEGSYLVYDIIEEYKEFQNNLLQTVIDHLNEVYTEIENDSRNINDFLGEIEKVTKNLNMLAVNASIEAARAGEEGSGFSVVANEVKELSEKSSDLVQNIEEINKDIINLNGRITKVVDELKKQSAD